MHTPRRRTLILLAAVAVVGLLLYCVYRYFAKDSENFAPSRYYKDPDEAKYFAKRLNNMTTVSFSALDGDSIVADARQLLPTNLRRSLRSKNTSHALFSNDERLTFDEDTGALLCVAGMRGPSADVIGIDSGKDFSVVAFVAPSPNMDSYVVRIPCSGGDISLGMFVDGSLELSLPDNAVMTADASEAVEDAVDDTADADPDVTDTENTETSNEGPGEGPGEGPDADVYEDPEAGGTETGGESFTERAPSARASRQAYQLVTLLRTGGKLSVFVDAAIAPVMSVSLAADPESIKLANTSIGVLEPVDEPTLDSKPASLSYVGFFDEAVTETDRKFMMTFLKNEFLERNEYVRQMKKVIRKHRRREKAREDADSQVPIAFSETAIVEACGTAVTMSEAMSRGPACWQAINRSCADDDEEGGACSIWKKFVSAMKEDSSEAASSAAAAAESSAAAAAAAPSTAAAAAAPSTAAAAAPSTAAASAPSTAAAAAPSTAAASASSTAAASASSTAAAAESSAAAAAQPVTAGSGAEEASAQV